MAKMNYHIISGSTYDVLSVCKFRYQLLNGTRSIHVLPLFCLINALFGRTNTCVVCS